MTIAFATVRGQKAKQKSQQQEDNEGDKNDSRVMSGIDFHKRFL